jgi:pimeloyl-ACP methyl ester carboxylesterase
MTEYLDFATPEGLRVRGTVLLLPGRGENASTYNRFGRRIAADAWRVRVVPVGGVASDLSEELSAALADLGPEFPRPLVLVGADASAAVAAALVATTSDTSAVWYPDAVVLAGLPGYGTHDIGNDWESELEVRTHCPAHRGVLTDDASFNRGTLDGPVDDALLDAAYGSTVSVPHLILVGEQDQIADREALTRLAKALPVARLSVVRDAHHDVLNDLQHRSVAAEVVTFLEVLRDGTPLRPIVTAESSAW